jgi:hypothetical protein
MPRPLAAHDRADRAIMALTSFPSLLSFSSFQGVVHQLRDIGAGDKTIYGVASLDNGMEFMVPVRPPVFE